jgi:HAD superfamily hydrolase (TIGR01509 family)
MTLKLVIFDCDGVLVDTEAISNAVMSACLDRHGFQISADDCRLRFVGRSIESVQAEIEAELGRPLGAGWPELVRTETEAAFDRGVPQIPGVEKAIEVVAVAGLKYCVASSGKFSKMRKSLGQSGLLRHFEDVLFSAEQVTKGKPAPDLFLFAAEAMKVRPEACVVIEDSVPGVQAAVAAGMDVLAYAGDPMSVRSGLVRTGARAFYEMAELPELLGLVKPR